jgi:hypothetical protein
MSEKTKQYLNGIYASKRNGQYGEFFNLSFRKQQVIEELQKLKEDDKGFVNFKMTSQKVDPNKYSVYVDDFVPSTKKNPVTDEPVYAEDSSDSLPF